MQAIGLFMMALGTLGTLYNGKFIVNYMIIKRKIRRSGEDLDGEDGATSGPVVEYYASMLAIGVVVLLAGIYLTF
jgi:hypothetical protein